MIKIWGSSELPRLDLEDFDTEEYRCIAYCVKKDGGLVGAFMSEKADPPHFRVVDGAKEMFYTHREDALAYLDRVEPKPIGRRKRQ